MGQGLMGLLLCQDGVVAVINHEDTLFVNFLSTTLLLITVVIVIVPFNFECWALTAQVHASWVREVISLLHWGSSSGWCGLGCPAHCSASFGYLCAFWISGFCLGFSQHHPGHPLVRFQANPPFLDFCCSSDLRGSIASIASTPLGVLV